MHQYHTSVIHQYPGHQDGHPLSLLLPGRVSAHCSVVTVSRARPARLSALCGITRVRLEMLLRSWLCPDAHRSAEDGSQGRGDQGCATKLEAKRLKIIPQNKYGIIFHLSRSYNLKEVSVKLYGLT